MWSAPYIPPSVVNLLHVLKLEEGHGGDRSHWGERAKNAKGKIAEFSHVLGYVPGRQFSKVGAVRRSCGAAVFIGNTVVDWVEWNRACPWAADSCLAASGLLLL